MAHVGKSVEILMSSPQMRKLEKAVLKAADNYDLLKSKYNKILQENIDKDKEIKELKARLENSVPRMPEADEEFSKKIDKVLQSKRRPRRVRKL